MVDDEAHSEDADIKKSTPPPSLGLFAYPGQSNLTGRRLPLGWPRRIREAKGKLRNTYTLLDAAALAMTSPMARVFADPNAAPDFVCVSFYKVFGFPDLGGLVVRKDSGHVLTLVGFSAFLLPPCPFYDETNPPNRENTLAAALSP